MLYNLGHDTRDHTKYALKTLKSFIDHDNWIISGSAAHPRIRNPNDIDVFFHTKEDFEKAVTSFELKYNAPGAMTRNTYTFWLDWDRPAIQLIHKTLGTPQELFDQFDLNICKYGILPNGNKIRDVTATSKITINKLSADTFKRYFKYMKYLGIKNTNYEHERCLIDKYITDTTILENFYDKYHKESAKMPANSILFKEIKRRGQPIAYLQSKAMEYAPELLL